EVTPAKSPLRHSLPDPLRAGSNPLAPGRGAMYTRVSVPVLAVLSAGSPIITRNARVVMGRLVMKFGGTSVANIDRIRNVARHVKREADARPEEHTPEL